MTVRRERPVLSFRTPSKWLTNRPEWETAKRHLLDNRIIVESTPGNSRIARRQ